MKRLMVLAALIAVPLVAAAQMKDKAAVYKATGVVTKTDKDKVTIKHEPVQSMNWPAMTMSFQVKDKALMEMLKKDQKVEFEFVQQGRDYVVIGVK